MSFNQNADYWIEKIKAYLHDPFDKALRIQKHEERAEDYLEAVNITYVQDDPVWKEADRIAASFERGSLPGYSKDPKKNGAVDFLEESVITHPLSAEDSLLNIGLPKGANVEDVREDIIDRIKADVKKIAAADEIASEQRQSSDKDQTIQEQQDQNAYLHFLYLHLILRFRLANENTGKLGALWHRMPADTRIPDHSIWQHNALTSALYSSSQLAGGMDKVGMMAYSITPVQAFISTARKLRDYWTGSVLLSWMAFEGIRWVSEHLGPDHILYPSLIDQPLVLEYLQKGGFPEDWINEMNSERKIASFPNKFLFLVPLEQSKSIAAEIQKYIKSQWKDLYKRIEKLLTTESEEEDKFLLELFDRQCENYWDFNWSAVSLLEKGGIYETLLSKDLYGSSDKLFEAFESIFKQKYGSRGYQFNSKGLYYSVTHSLTQSVLAAEKLIRDYKAGSENGEKCHLCGEREIAHPFENKSDWKAKEYKKKVGGYWKELYSKYSGDFNEDERLCSLCLIKRLAYRILEKDENYILNKTFKNQSAFVSTTEMALRDYFDSNNLSKKDQQAIAQDLHEFKSDDIKWGELVCHFPGLKEKEKPKDEDFYYAILMMDGDKMGDLINGKTIGAKWETVLAPSVAKRLKGENGFSDSVFINNWSNIFSEQRSVTPAIHAAISEALGDFSIYQVAPIVKKYCGRLIYAGGDDVCAIFPVSHVLQAANEIRQAYTQVFYEVKNNGGNIVTKEISSSYDVNDVNCTDTKLSIGMGKAGKISISAGILICHHKESLSDMIKASHVVLDKYAKDQACRNAVAIELRKRSGGSRYFATKWEDKRLQSFISLIGDKSADLVSTSLLYRLQEYEIGIKAILKKEDFTEDEKRTKIKDFVLYHVKHSGNSEDSLKGLEKDEKKQILSAIS